MMDDGWSGKGSRSRKDGVGECRSQGLRKERAWQWRMIVEDDNDKEHE
jgi:hypothetical protein